MPLPLLSTSIFAKIGYFLGEIGLFSHLLCSEANFNEQESNNVAQVVLNRIEFYQTDLVYTITQPLQFVYNRCKYTKPSLMHVRVALRAYFGHTEAHPTLKDIHVTHFMNTFIQKRLKTCGKSAGMPIEDVWRLRRMVPVYNSPAWHTFWANLPKKAPKMPKIPKKVASSDI